ncbi:hypothetical protein M9H77_02338 [Catharanthus roseus]|uniref:Uncharacterized protein n=1 Tax=Catharanthus roseus TaxID=4058 RepID=A0ACC0C864_CATRO|nr:hypothetical protein M9H77_02338 [Catharanthus roseus]
MPGRPKKKKRLGQDDMPKNTYPIQKLPRKGNMTMTCNLISNKIITQEHALFQMDLYWSSYYKCSSSSRTSISNYYEPRKSICKPAKYDEEKTDRDHLPTFIEDTNSIIKPSYGSHQQGTH